MRAFWEPTDARWSPAQARSGSSPRCSACNAGSTCTCSTAPTTGPKPELVEALGATYHTGAVHDVGFEPDIVIEATGVPQVVVDAIAVLASGGVVCLTGIGSSAGTLAVRARRPTRRTRSSSRTRSSRAR